MESNSKFLTSYRKVKLAGGGIPMQWGPNSQMGDSGGLIGMGAGLLDTLTPPDEWGYRSDGAAVGSGALKGAAAGAMLGPLGMAAGALIGGATSFIGNNKQQAEARKAKFQHQSSARMEARNYNLGVDMSSFKTGGRYITGGQVVPISSKAIAFKGNSPEQTDGINLGDGTFVDHNEAMVKTAAGNIVASDKLYLGGSKRSVASQVKSLQRLRDKSKIPEKQAFYDYRTDVKLAQQELEAGRIDPKVILSLAEPGGDSKSHGGIGDMDPNFHPEVSKDINFKYGGITVNDSVLTRVADYCRGGKYATGGKKEEYIDKLAESSSEEREHQLEMGIENEAEEHNKSLKEGKTIASQHLKEDSKYYTKLKKAGLTEGGAVPTENNAIPGKYIPGPYGYLENQPEIAKPIGQLSKAEYQQFLENKENIPELRKNIPDARWRDVMNLMERPEIQGVSMSNIPQPYGPGGAEVMGTWKDYSVPGLQGLGVNSQMSVPQAPNQLPYTQPTEEMNQGSNKVNAFKYNIPKSKKFQEGLHKMVGYAGGGGLDPFKPGVTYPSVNTSGQYINPFDQSLGNPFQQNVELPSVNSNGQYVDPRLQPTGPFDNYQLNPFKPREGFMPPMQIQQAQQQTAQPAGPFDSHGLNPFKPRDRFMPPLGTGPAQIPAQEQPAVPGPFDHFKLDPFKPRNSFMPPMDHTAQPYNPTIAQPSTPAATNTPGAPKTSTAGTPRFGGPVDAWGQDFKFKHDAPLGTGLQKPVMPESPPMQKVTQPGNIQGYRREQQAKNLNDFARGAAVFGPDLINSMSYLNTPRVPNPDLVKPTVLRRANNRAQQAQIAEAGRAATQGVINNGSQMGTTMAGVNAVMASKMGAIGQANEALTNTNLQIGNQEAFLRHRADVLNTGIKNQFKQDKLSRQLAIRKGIASGIASIGNKGQQLYAEKDKKAMDMQAMDTLKAGYTSGAWDRNITPIQLEYLKKRGLIKE